MDVYLSELCHLAQLVAPAIDDSWIKYTFVTRLPDNTKHQLKVASLVEAMMLELVVAHARNLININE